MTVSHTESNRLLFFSSGLLRRTSEPVRGGWAELRDARRGARPWGVQLTPPPGQPARCTETRRLFHRPLVKTHSLTPNLTLPWHNLENETLVELRKIIIEGNSHAVNGGGLFGSKLALAAVQKHLQREPFPQWALTAKTKISANL